MKKKRSRWRAFAIVMSKRCDGTVDPGLYGPMMARVNAIGGHLMWGIGARGELHIVRFRGRYATLRDAVSPDAQVLGQWMRRSIAIVRRARPYLRATLRQWRSVRFGSLSIPSPHDDEDATDPPESPRGLFIWLKKNTKRQMPNTWKRMGAVPFIAPMATIPARLEPRA